MADTEDPYVSPAKKKLEDALAKMGSFASPALREIVEDALADLDHTNPEDVRVLLPPAVLAVYQNTLVRAASLVPLIKHAHDSRCFIQSIILSHGLVQFALRGLYVMAWQRAVMPEPLTEADLAPYVRQRSKQGDVFPLVAVLEENNLLQGKQHADHLRMVNDVRNKAAHGVIFGEIPQEELEERSRKCQWAALGALDTFKAWFNNARPLQLVPKRTRPDNNAMNLTNRGVPGMKERRASGEPEHG